MQTDKKWFESWFDSPYYHILYRNRDDKEAGAFIDNLTQYLVMSEDSFVLDLACGKGRHSVYLMEKGFNVTGLDLSEANIDFARQFENKKLEFYIHDMRKAFRSNYYDYILNLFSSFGYFETEKEEVDSLKYVAKALKKGGVFILDFLNAEYVKKKLPESGIKTIDGIEFSISKFIEGDFVYKTISFLDKGTFHRYVEKVKLLSPESFEDLFQKAGLTITELKGDYHLNEFNPETSERLIIISKKS
jgi:SAM-dependent methyltransferase